MSCQELSFFSPPFEVGVNLGSQKRNNCEAEGRMCDTISSKQMAAALKWKRLSVLACIIVPPGAEILPLFHISYLVTVKHKEQCLQFKREVREEPR